LSLPKKHLKVATVKSFHFIPLILTTLFLACSKKSENQTVQYTAEDGSPVASIEQADGNVRVEVVGPGKVPKAAQQLHEKGRQLGAAGNYDAALDAFKKASAIAPGWAYPLYDSAFTYLLRDDYTNALAKYREVDALEPQGFFTAKTAIWTLQREGTKFPSGLYRDYVALESMDEKQKKQLVEQIAEKIPDFAPIWKEKALLATDPTEKLRHIDRGLALNPDLETFGTLSINRAAALNQLNKTAEARAILQSLDATNQTTWTRQMAKETLKKL